MTERLAPDGSAVFRRYDELFPEKDHARLAEVENRTETDEMMQARRQRHRRVELFSAFLDTGLRTLDGAPERIRDRELHGTLGFALRLRVSVPDYEVDGSLLFWRRHHYEGSALFDRDLVFLAFPDPAVPGGWGLAWGDNAADPTNDRLRIITETTPDEPQDVPDLHADPAPPGASGYRRNPGELSSSGFRCARRARRPSTPGCASPPAAGTLRPRNRRQRRPRVPVSAA